MNNPPTALGVFLQIEFTRVLNRFVFIHTSLLSESHVGTTPNYGFATISKLNLNSSFTFTVPPATETGFIS
jgi:hypothetical protein